MQPGKSTAKPIKRLGTGSEFVGFHQQFIPGAFITAMKAND